MLWGRKLDELMLGKVCQAGSKGGRGSSIMAVIVDGNGPRSNLLSRLAVLASSKRRTTWPELVN